MFFWNNIKGVSTSPPHSLPSANVLLAVQSLHYECNENKSIPYTIDLYLPANLTVNMLILNWELWLKATTNHPYSKCLSNTLLSSPQTIPIS